MTVPTTPIPVPHNNSYDTSNRDTNTTSLPSLDTFGDNIHVKYNNNLRVAFININGIPDNNDDPKNNVLYSTINELFIDILGIAETNRCWHLLPSTHRWRERSLGWWETLHSSISYNTQDVHPLPYQPGGNLLLSINKPAHRVIDSGSDPSGLGRWCYTIYRGKQNTSLCIISAYRPSKTYNGTNSCYNQQQRYFNTISDIRCPREAFLEDLQTFISVSRQNGHQILVMLDANDDVRKAPILTWIRNNQLLDSILSRHPPSSAPATQHTGRCPIDTILHSHTIRINQSGYLPFGHFMSDHRSLWIDIDYSNAFGYNMPKTIIPAARRLKSDHPTVRNLWIHHYMHHLELHDLPNKLFQLESEILRTGTFSPAQQKLYQSIRRLRNEGIQYADKRCRKLKMSNIPFSPILQRAAKTVELWKGILSRRSGTKYSISKIRRLQKTLNLPDAMLLSSDDINIELTQAQATYSQLCKTASQHRLTFLESKASAIATESNLSSDNIYTQLIHREKQRLTFRRIRYATKRSNGGGVSRVELINEDGSIQEITTKEGIEKACMDENYKKYQQTSRTPCMIDPLKSELGFLGLTAAADAILNGTYQPPPNTNIYVRELFSHLQRAELLYPPPSNYLSVDTFVQGWRKMKEKTSAGISGRHFGHFKACTFNHLLSSFESSLSSIPYRTGFIPDEWKYGVMVMIQKKAHVDLITKLRTIVLTEADFNFNNKILGKMTLEHAERNGLIPKEQYGSRKGKSSIYHAIHKRLTYDIFRQGRRAGALCANDAKSNYDRIIHSIAMIAYRRLGIPIEPVKCMLETIQHMKHHIRTTFGDSEFHMSTIDKDKPFMGLMQGNGASPTTWIIVSSVLIEMLRSARNGAFFKNPISNIVHQIVGYAFVDDTDLIQHDMRDNTLTDDDVMEKMQVSINRWEGGLKATGGAIEPSKTWVYPVCFHFHDNGDWTYKSVEDIDFTFTVLDDNEVRCNLSSLEVTDSQETLGVFLAPDGNNKKMISVLRQKSEEWRTSISSGHLQKTETWLALETGILKSLQYPLPALTMTERECTFIMAPVLAGALSSSGINSKYPKRVSHGPISEGGLGIPNLYIYQGISRISILQEHIAAPTLTGDLLRTSLELCQVEIGIGRSLFMLPYSLYQHILTDCWLKHCWIFSQQMNLTIVDRFTPLLTLQRENDVFLMEEICNSGFFTPTQLRRINNCRLYLQVSTLSDICNGYGDRFSASAIQCLRDHTIPHRYSWPIQPRPNLKIRRLWKRALNKCFPRHHQTLLQPLGKWLHQPSQQWTWFYDPLTTNLYQHVHHHWQIWRRCHQHGRVGRSPIYTKFTTGTRLPLSHKQATVEYITHNRVKLTGWDFCLQQPLPINTMHHPSKFPPWIKQPVDIIPPHIITDIQHSLNNNHIIIVSDGSYSSHLHLGTAAWVIYDTNHNHKLSGYCRTPGDSMFQSSHRSELTGILGAIVHMSQICIHWNIQAGSITLGCDGLNAIRQVQSSFDTIKNNIPHFDLLHSIKQAIKHSPLTWHFRHVKGHQDELYDYHNLDLWSRLNIEADELAKSSVAFILDDPNWETQTIHNLPYEYCSLLHHSRLHLITKVSSNMHKTTTELLTRDTIRTFWRDHRHFSSLTERFIDWELFHRTNLSMNKQRHIWVSKWLTGFLGVGTMMFFYKQQLHHKCPRCYQPNESSIHIVQCPHPDATILWTTMLTKLRDWIIKHHGGHTLANTIFNHLNSWRNGTLPSHSTSNNTLLDDAIHDQHRIGWKGFLEGFFSIKWRLFLDSEFQHQRIQRSSILWLVRLQRRIWEIPWELWLHRNSLLHGDGSQTHHADTIALNSEIIDEWSLGRQNLPDQYLHLFQGELSTRLMDDFRRKRMWLTSVWAARDLYPSTTPRTRNPTASLFYQIWKDRNRSRLNLD